MARPRTASSSEQWLKVEGMMTLLEAVAAPNETAAGEVAVRDTESDESSSSDLSFHFFLCRARFINEENTSDSLDQKQHRNRSHLGYQNSLRFTYKLACSIYSVAFSAPSGS